MVIQAYDASHGTASRIGKRHTGTNIMATKQAKPRLTTLQKLGNVLPSAVAQMQAIAAPYSSLAKSLATDMAAGKVAAGAATDARKGTWAAFKEAIDVAQATGHDAKALRTGLEIACEEAGIPTGSFRGYVSTVCNLFTDLTEGRLERAEVEAISVADARARYADEGKKLRKEQQARLLAAFAKLQGDDVITLVEAAEDMAGIERAKPAGEGEEEEAPQAIAA